MIGGSYDWRHSLLSARIVYCIINVRTAYTRLLLYLFTFVSSTGLTRNKLKQCMDKCKRRVLPTTPCARHKLRVRPWTLYSPGCYLQAWNVLIQTALRLVGQGCCHRLNFHVDWLYFSVCSQLFAKQNWWMCLQYDGMCLYCCTPRRPGIMPPSYFPHGDITFLGMFPALCKTKIGVCACSAQSTMYSNL